MPRNRRFATVEKSYITDIERERCKKVAAAYANSASGLEPTASFFRWPPCSVSR